MIKDITMQNSTIPDTRFTYTPQISRFMQALEYNMKARAGINPSVSSEDIAAQRNLEADEDVMSATENALLKTDRSDPENTKKVLDNFRAIGQLLQSNPATAVIESFTDAEMADRIVTDGVYRINATNTDQDYPMYMTRGAIFESQLIDSLENDNPSLYSYARRFGVPPALAIAGNVIKGAAGITVAHGATAAYDVARLGTSIQNVQKKYYDWRNRLLDDKTLTYEQFLEESKNLLADLKKNVPEEYRYEIYKALQEGPDPFADLGNSFTGLATDIGLIKPVSLSAKAGYSAAKKAMKGVTSSASTSKNVQTLKYNEELAEKIKDFATNKVNEETVEDMVDTKAVVNMPKEAEPELQETVKGIVKEQNSDDNLLQNTNGDFYRYDLAVSQEDIEAHNTASTVAKMNEEPTTTLYEIIPESRRPKQNYYIDHGKGVNNLPMTFEEAMKEMNLRQTHKEYIPVFDEKGLKYREENPLLLEEPDEIAFTSASVDRWIPDDEGVIRPYYSEITDRSGEGGSIEGKGVYATDVGGYEVSRNNYLVHSHQKRAEINAQVWDEDKILKKENFKDVENKVDNKKLFERIKRRFVYDLSNLDSLNEYNIKEINIGFDEDYVKDLEKYLAKRNGEDLIYDLESKRESVYQAIQNFYYEGASLDDLKDYAKKIAVLETIQALFRGGAEKPTSWLNTFTGPNPYKYPEKYIFNGMDYEPEVFGSFMGPRNDVHKKSINKFEDWKRDIKKKALNKGYRPVHGFGKMTGNERWERDDWFKAVEVASGLKGDAQKKWYRKELQKLGGYSATLHEHHDGTLNIVTINDKDFSEVTKIENNPEVVDNYLQIGYNNAHMIVSAGDGVGYFVRELHGVEGSKPMIVKNYKVIDKGDWK